MTDQFQDLLTAAHKIVVLQADNPDADSLGSALALEALLTDLGKSVYLYCGVDTPGYLKYLEGWSRVLPELPSKFDLAIVVDASSMSLFETLPESARKTLHDAPCIVLDHHEVTDNSLPFSDLVINRPELSSTGELIYTIAKQLDWPLSTEAGEYLMTSVLGDTQGLTNDLVSEDTYRMMADLTHIGVNRPSLEEKRREASKMELTIYKYKAELIARTEFYYENACAIVEIPQDEIMTYSPLYNPGPLIQPDILSVSGVKIGIVLKKYDDGKVTAMIRCNPSARIANALAQSFNGGGHGFAAGFKIEKCSDYPAFKRQLLTKVEELLA